jgi:dienelactone hydrolase
MVAFRNKSPMKTMRWVALLLTFWASQQVFAAEASIFPKPGEAKAVHFEEPLPHIEQRSAELKYDFDFAKETFEVFVPKNYSSTEKFGLFAFIDSQNEMTFPAEWMSLMEKQKLICLIPQKIGNDQPPARRLGLTLVGVMAAAQQYNIDRKRIFTGGYSGGARCALHLAFLHSDVIKGNVSICGADFYEPVPRVRAADNRNYGVWPVAREKIAEAKSNVRFVFITGEKDLRYGNIVDICEGGYKRNSFVVNLIDVPGMGHQLCKSEILEQGIEFLDNRTH